MKLFCLYSEQGRLTVLVKRKSKCSWNAAGVFEQACRKPWHGSQQQDRHGAEASPTCLTPYARTLLSVEDRDDVHRLRVMSRR